MIEVGPYVISLPPKFTELRPHQEEAILEIDNLLDHNKVVFLDAPTGAGKTIIGESVRQVRQQKSIYLCSTLTLQDQFLSDFPYARLIKGRSNYPTADMPERFKARGARRVDASFCTKKGHTTDQYGDDGRVCSTCDLMPPDTRLTGNDGGPSWFLHCDFCHPWQTCPYEIAKQDALASDLAVANTAYYLAEANFIGYFGSMKVKDEVRYAFDLVILDEADTIEDVLMGHISLDISKRQIKKLGLKPPDKVTKPESWMEWAVGAVDHIAGQMRGIPQKDPESMKEYQDLDRLKGSVQRLYDALKLDEDNWIYDGKDGNVKFRPVEIHYQARNHLWKHAPSWLLMSATLISPDQMAEDLGLMDHEWDVVSVDSNFPVSSRPVIVRPTASVTNKTKEEAYPKIADQLEIILKDHSNERILVHTVSYAFSQYLYEEMQKRGHGHRVLTYSSSMDRERTIEEYRRTYAAVLLAPSLDRGVDFPDDECRVIVIAKMPFLNLGDKQVSKRLYGTPGGNSWYATKTVRSLVQMTGRGMRHRGDRCVTYVLDDQFKKNVWRNSLTRNKLPKWWKDSVKWEV